jgi:iron complex outermembrane receptor protein
MAKAEYDLTDSWTVYAGLGAQHAHEIGTYSAPKLLTKTAMPRLAVWIPTASSTLSGMGGVRGDFIPALSRIR